MFIDEVKVKMQAGKWGDGIVAWRREKYIPNGGPYGGDGGDGGSIILRSTTHETTLTNFRHRKVIKAGNGQRGKTKEMHGANAEDTILEVPVGTIVIDSESGEVLFDFVRDGQEFLVCEGGRGGFGNAHFPSSTRQAPHFAELGDQWEKKEVKLELKLVADVGLVGFPNAGKSTLIQALTNVKPKIANYAFTTITPNLGVMEWKNRSLVIEDVPGLIEWASDGKGLGFQFLKHIDRCKTLLHLLDASQGEEKVITEYQTIRKEIEKWDAFQAENNENNDLRTSLAERKEIIIFSKADLIDADHMQEMREIFEKETGKKVALLISAGAYMQIDELKDILIKETPENRISEDENTKENEDVKVYDLKKQTNDKNYTIEALENGDFRVTGVRIEEIARMTDTRYPDGVGRVYDALEKFGILRKIKLKLHEKIESEWFGFFEWEDDVAMPSILIGEKAFSLDGIMFTRKNI